ncbi:hypothetical protein HY732_02985 [Candidatus Uhrbacteria bacterium]|nr:hypothetical protein [Candidatus Uhrbacteria bacterium]
MATVQEEARAESEQFVFERERKKNETADTFELLKMVVEQLHTIETGITLTEALLKDAERSGEELPGVSETLQSIEDKLGIPLAHETRRQIEHHAEMSAAQGIELLLGRMHKRKEYLEKRQEKLEAVIAEKKEIHEGGGNGAVAIDANFDTVAEREKIKNISWQTAYQDGIYRIKTAAVSIPYEKEPEHKKGTERKEVHLILIENISDSTSDVVLALEHSPRANMMSIPEVFEELEKMGTARRRSVVEIDAERRTFIEDLIRANLLRGSIIDGPHGSLRLTIRDQAVPWSFLPPDEFVAMGRINARKNEGSMDAVEDLNGHRVPREVFINEDMLWAYLKGGDAWKEKSREHGGRTYTTKSGKEASQDKS